MSCHADNNGVSTFDVGRITEFVHDDLRAVQNVNHSIHTNTHRALDLLRHDTRGVL